MAQYLIVRVDGPTPIVTQIVVATEDADPGDLVKQGFTGPGRYAVTRWDVRQEFELGSGPPVAERPQDDVLRLENLGINWP